METYSDSSLSVLSELQRKVIILKREQKSTKEISRMLCMSKTQIEEICSLAELKIDQYELSRDNEQKIMTFSDMELKIILEAMILKRVKDLSLLSSKYKHIAKFGITDYNYDMLVRTIDKIENALSIDSMQKIADAIKE